MLMAARSSSVHSTILTGYTVSCALQETVSVVHLSWVFMEERRSASVQENTSGWLADSRCAGRELMLMLKMIS